MYKTLRKDSNIPEEHIQKLWQTNRGGYNTVEVIKFPVQKLRPG